MSIEIEILKSGIEFAGAIKELVSSKENTKDHSLGDKLTKSLRVMYFTPVGVLSFLRRLERGEKLSLEEIKKALIDFNDREPKVGRALGELEYKALGKELRVNLATIRTLDLVGIGKLELRREIQQEINFYGQRGYSPDIPRIAALIKQIEQLNKAIEEVEAFVNNRAK